MGTVCWWCWSVQDAYCLPQRLRSMSQETYHGWWICFDYKIVMFRPSDLSILFDNFCLEYLNHFKPVISWISTLTPVILGRSGSTCEGCEDSSVLLQKSGSDGPLKAQSITQRNAKRNAKSNAKKQLKKKKATKRAVNRAMKKAGSGDVRGQRVPLSKAIGVSSKQKWSVDRQLTAVICHDFSTKTIFFGTA